MAVCRACHTELPEGARFCPACGAPVDGSPLEGLERKVVTVLFADLAGSTVFGATRDPEDVQAVIQPYFARVRAELERFGGTFEKFIGDAVMALFGAPVSHEDDPDRAVRAALAIRDAIVESGTLDPELDLHVRIAVNTGEAVIALGARPAEGEGMAAGDVVNTAFRMQEAAPPNGVVVGEQTYRATRHSIEYGEDQLIAAKGKAEPVRIWEALRAETPRRPAYIGPGLAPLVGRREELNLLIDTLTRVRRESSVQLLTLTGVPGIGKSRLVWELLTALERDPALVSWRRGRCLPYGEGVSFWALGEMVKAEAGIVETDETDEAAEKVARCVQAVLPASEAAWVEGHLRPLAGIGLEAAPYHEGREESFAAWRRFIEALADRGLLVLVFEDLHWADDGLLDFVDYLADWAQGVPLLLVGTARPELLERRPDWGGGKRNSATIALSPLSNDETDRLVGFLLRRARLPEGIREALLSRSEGNPLYAEEYARMLGDRGLLDGAAAGDSLPLPESVQGIIASRLDTLPPDQKSLLHDAAVVGRGFWIGALARMADQPAAELEPSLHALELKDFVRRQRDSAVAGDRQYAFLHALVRDVSYAQIPRAQRAKKHCLAAEWLESLGRPEDHAEMLAHHYLSALEFARAAGQDPGEFAERARLALHDAGDRAASLNSFGSAMRYYAAALELWPEDDPGRARLLLDLGRARFHDEEAGAEELEAARHLLAQHGDLEGAAEAEVLMYTLLSNQGRNEEALERINRAAELLESAPASHVKTYALVTLSSFHLRGGRYPEAEEAAREALAIAEGLGLHGFQASALATVGSARTAQGDLGGVSDLERSIALAEESNLPEAVLGYMRLAEREVQLGNLARRAELHDRARRAAGRFGLARHVRWLRGELVAELYWNGHWDEALAVADDFVAESERVSPHYLESFCRVFRGQIRLGRGNVDGALADANHALELARAAGDPQLLYPALAFAARAFLQSGENDRAGELASELVGLVAVHSVSMTAWVADLGVALAELDRDEELGQITDAAQTPWGEAVRGLGGDDVPSGAGVFERIGSRPDAAYARLLAGERLILAGNRTDAERELARATTFFKEANAAAYLGRAEALLALPA